MFDTIRPTSCTIGDLNLGTYLMLRGAKLEGTTVQAPNRASFTFTHKHLADFVHEYHQGQEIRFSPKILFQFREDLKRLTIYPTSTPR